MLQLTKLSTMIECTHILQAEFLLRSLSLLDDAQLTRLLPHIRFLASHSQWYTISRTPPWRRCAQ
ncbi:hypothetical protein BCV72DRAFT_329938 [Rhizopus microsporus var. microsporus]|uniref:Uncharacterized protein n=1 Tax=Rhizopus microsporus var. microsporus TaxID=86635 RepID=A0A1X0R1S0_RHIZD|nr:hypothetical protein BCV72DRAFT_329938 [Rhizopus microsporus var. microsporus]